MFTLGWEPHPPYSDSLDHSGSSNLRPARSHSALAHLPAMPAKPLPGNSQRNSTHPAYSHSCDPVHTKHSSQAHFGGASVGRVLSPQNQQHRESTARRAHRESATSTAAVSRAALSLVGIRAHNESGSKQSTSGTAARKLRSSTCSHERKRACRSPRSPRCAIWRG